ncbi:MAG: DUF1273 family protein [Clostridia bacterium]|nr:DUF1273 family protein [Clostridia bacterium]
MLSSQHPQPVRSCCFTGHRPDAMPFRAVEGDEGFACFAQRLEDAVRTEIDRGTRHFITGMCAGMDLWAACVVLKLREELPELGITLEAAVPHPGQEKRWPESVQIAYRAILEACDTRTVLARHYFNGVMMVRNRYMVDHADACIAAMVPGTTGGGTYHTVQYALKKKKEVINILENA